MQADLEMQELEELEALFVQLTPKRKARRNEHRPACTGRGVDSSLPNSGNWFHSTRLNG